MDFRIGFGYDVHQLKESLPLTLGGIVISHHKGSFGHSDADVLIHAICDAILGAANLGDIGTHFPDNDPAYKGIDSKKLLHLVLELLGKSSYQIGNIDTTIHLEKPKVKPHIPEMRKVLAEVMGITENQLSIKATTNEKMGFVGQEEGIAAYAVVLIKSLD